MGLTDHCGQTMGLPDHCRATMGLTDHCREIRGLTEQCGATITFGILHSINRKNSLYIKLKKKQIVNQMFTKLGNSSLINLRIPCEEL